jgi:hypothetical protein
MPNISGSPPRRALTAFAALASLVLLAAPVERAVAASTPVTVTNPATSPARTGSVTIPAGAEEADENPERPLKGNSATLFGRACFSQDHACTAEVQIESFSTMTGCFAGMRKWFSGSGYFIREKLDLTRNVEDNNVQLRCGPPESVKKVEKDASLGVHLRRTV